MFPCLKETKPVLVVPNCVVFLMFKFGVEARLVLCNVQNLAYKHFNAILECGKFIHAGYLEH